MADTDFDQLESRLVTQLGTASTPGDIEKVSAALNNVVDAKKADKDYANASKTTRIDSVKDVATILVPVISLLTVAATVISQNEQTRATRDAGEDTEWREALAAISKDMLNPRSPAIAYDAITRLKPFFRSERYGTDARDFSVLILGKFTDNEIFSDLFAATFPDPHLRDLRALSHINQQLADTRKHINDDISVADDAAAEGPPGAPAAAATKASNASPTQIAPPSSGAPRPYPGFAMPPPPSKEALERAMASVEDEIQVVDNAIAVVLRARASGDNAEYDLSDNLFIGTDLRNANFRSVDLTGAQFWYSNLRGANFSTVKYFDYERFPGSAWWQASFIEASALRDLMRYDYPNYFNKKDSSYGNDMSYWHGEKPTRAEYATDIARLCGVAHIACPASAIQFGPDKHE